MHLAHRGIAKPALWQVHNPLKRQIICGLRHHAAARLVMLAVGYGTNDPNQHISLSQARNYWYHWYMATPRGEQTVVEDRAAFIAILKRLLSPALRVADR